MSAEITTGSFSARSMLWSDVSDHWSGSRLSVDQQTSVRTILRRWSYRCCCWLCSAVEIVRAFTYVINQGWALYWATSRWSPIEIMASSLYTVSQKNRQNYFCYNYVKLPPNLTIFGTMMANCLKLYEVHSFSTLTNSRQCTTVLNADVPNCYITL